MILTLARDRNQPVAYCTLGMLHVKGHVFHTIEPGAGSCLPVGTYRLEAVDSEARGKHWKIKNVETLAVPSLLHAANWAHELSRSVAPGKARKMSLGIWSVVESRSAMNEIRTLVGTSYDLQLTIEAPV